VIALLVQPLRAATDHAGRVTLANGVPVPGARVTATQGGTSVATTTSVQGIYRFTGLAESTWTVQVEMVGLAPQRRDLVVAADAPPATWELTVLPFTGSIAMVSWRSRSAFVLKPGMLGP
jgi:hypothetical protein